MSRKIIGGGGAWHNQIDGLYIFDREGTARARLNGVLPIDKNEIEEMVTKVAEAMGLITLSPPEPRFMYECTVDGTCDFSPLSEMLQANVDAPEFCEWLRRAEIGYRFSNGGGAAPLLHTWRVS